MDSDENISFEQLILLCSCGNGDFWFAVKPTILFSGEKTPVMSDVDKDNDENNLEPIGDLADLTASVHEGMPMMKIFQVVLVTMYPTRAKGKVLAKASPVHQGLQWKK